MTRDEIIAMAQEAGFEWSEMGLRDRICFERFAALVAAKEREACANLAADTFYGNAGELNHVIAADIRARGQA